MFERQSFPLYPYLSITEPTPHVNVHLLPYRRNTHEEMGVSYTHSRLSFSLGGSVFGLKLTKVSGRGMTTSLPLMVIFTAPFSKAEDFLGGLGEGVGDTLACWACFTAKHKHWNVIHGWTGRVFNGVDSAQSTLSFSLFHNDLCIAVYLNVRWLIICRKGAKMQWNMNHWRFLHGLSSVTELKFATKMTLNTTV